MGFLFIPTGLSLIIHGSVAVVANVFPSLEKKPRKIGNSFFGFVFVAASLIIITAFAGFIILKTFNGHTNLDYIILTINLFMEDSQKIVLN